MFVFLTVKRIPSTGEPIRSTAFLHGAVFEAETSCRQTSDRTFQCAIVGQEEIQQYIRHTNHALLINMQISKTFTKLQFRLVFIFNVDMVSLKDLKLV